MDELIFDKETALQALIKATIKIADDHVRDLRKVTGEGYMFFTCKGGTFMQAYYVEEEQGYLFTMVVREEEGVSTEVRYSCNGSNATFHSCYILGGSAGERLYSYVRGVCYSYLDAIKHPQKRTIRFECTNKREGDDYTEQDYIDAHKRLTTKPRFDE